MTNTITLWWRGRTQRERRLLQIAGVLMVGVLLPAILYQAASAYRREAGADLARAENTFQILRTLQAARGSVLPANDGSVRGLVGAAAAAVQLPVPTIEPIGAERVRVVFPASSSQAIFSWLNLVSQEGLYVSKTTLARIGQAGLISAEFDVARTP